LVLVAESTVGVLMASLKLGARGRGASSLQATSRNFADFT
jgi:hypothetical protein